MTAIIELSRLAEPFPATDIEWRVSRAGTGQRGPWCKVLAYITARAIQKRLDDVCGPENWRVEEPRVLDINGKAAFAVGISIRIGDEFITKFDVAEPTNIEPAKGGFSGAMKRAGAQWGIGRYLYHLDETYADVSEDDPKVRGWHWAKLPKDGGTYFWKEPQLPGWALPKDCDISQDQLNDLKKAWKEKFAADVDDPASLRDGFGRFVTSQCGEFPIDDHTCWTLDAWTTCFKHILDTDDPEGISAEVPFDSEE